MNLLNVYYFVKLNLYSLQHQKAKQTMGYSRPPVLKSGEVLCVLWPGGRSNDKQPDFTFNT